jgi:hypothetical protein
MLVPLMGNDLGRKGQKASKELVRKSRLRHLRCRKTQKSLDSDAMESQVGFAVCTASGQVLHNCTAACPCGFAAAKSAQEEASSCDEQRRDILPTLARIAAASHNYFGYLTAFAATMDCTKHCSDGCCAFLFFVGRRDCVLQLGDSSACCGSLAIWDCESLVTCTYQTCKCSSGHRLDTKLV